MIQDKFDIKELQKVELDILKCFINICKKENLRYYAVGGTLLGAVRHKGFIPWDDDIDVAMPRKDYEKFLEVAQKYLPEQYFLQTFRTDSDWPANCAKIRNSSTTFWENCLQTFDINFGVYIDIFPLDFYPMNIFKKMYVDLKNKFLVYRIKKDYFNTVRGDTKFSIKVLIKNIIFPVAKWLYPHTRDAVIAREKIIRSTYKSTLYRSWDGLYDKREIVPIEWFVEGIALQFENLFVLAPKEYKKYLTQIYGDYMKLPPKEKQVLKHGAKVIDLNKPYTYYTKNKYEDNKY